MAAVGTLLVAGTMMCTVGAGDRLQIAVGSGLPPIDAEGRAQPEQWAARISWTAAPGEFEPGVLTLLSESDLDGVKIEPGDLSGPRGRAIPADCVRLRRVVFRGAKPKKDAPVVVAPEFLFPFDGKLNLKAGEPTLVWLTLAVPDDAAPGDYAGRLTVSFPGGRRRVSLKVRVLPFRLAEPKPVLSMLYTYEFRTLDRHEPGFLPAEKRRDPKARAAFVARGMRVVRDMAEHGMNMIFPHSDKYWNLRGGEPHFPDLEMSLQAAREYGMTRTPGWVVSWFTHAQWKDLPKFDEAKDTARLRALALRASAIAKAYGHKEIIILPSDEPNHARKRVVARKLLEAVRDMEGVRWAVTGSPETLRDLSELYQIAIVAGGTPEDWRDLKERGLEVWIYENNSTTGKSPTWSRFVYGLFGWRAGFDGVTSWTYPADVGDYRGGRTDARDDSKIPTFTDDGRPVNTIVWEAIREGIDDRRYIETLEAEIAAASAAGRKAAAARAQEVLSALWNRVDPRFREHGWEHTEYGSPRPKGFEWKDLEEVRAKIVEAILDLKGRTP